MNSWNQNLSGIDHDTVWNLLPWFVNETLPLDEKASVQAHVRGCLTCRRELNVQHRLHRLVAEAPTINVSSRHGFDALMRKIDGDPVVRGQPDGEATRIGTWLRDLLNPRLPAVAVAVVFCGLLAASLLISPDQTAPTRMPAYSTLTNDVPAPEYLLDIVFAEQATEADIRHLLTEINGRIVFGPSSTGVVTVQISGPERSDARVKDVLARLGKDPHVRFAERAYLERRSPQ